MNEKHKLPINCKRDTKVLMLMIKKQGFIQLSVKGMSMFPILKSGDIITVRRKQPYSIGDILVFSYNNEQILVHRLLKIDGNIYFCKGDNSFRLEMVRENNIIGSVILLYDKNNNSDFVIDSYAIYRLFCKNEFDSQKTMLSAKYINYRNKYLK